MSTAPKRFTEGLVSLMGADVALLGRSGTSAVADSSRVGTRRVACLQVAGHTLLPCDQDLLAAIEKLDDDTVSLSDADFRTWVDSVGGSVVGQEVRKVVGVDGLQLVGPIGTVHRFDWSRAADVELMQAFVDRCEAPDLDEAEVDMKDLDRLAIALLGDDGAIRAYASSRRYEKALPFGDIAILTSGAQRSSGLGRSAVSVLVRDVLLPSGIDPLYRCDLENLGSHRLSDALGFETVAALTVAELPSA